MTAGPGLGGGLGLSNGLGAGLGAGKQAARGERDAGGRQLGQAAGSRLVCGLSAWYGVDV